MAIILLLAIRYARVKQSTKDGHAMGQLNDFVRTILSTL
jgi:hypothetical protein